MAELLGFLVPPRAGWRKRGLSSDRGPAARPAYWASSMSRRRSHQ